MNFWLPVRQEYILDNLDSLISYLSHITYSEKSPNIGYEDTFKCLKELAWEIGNSIRTDATHTINLPECGLDSAIRILGAVILTGQQAGDPQWQAISDLALLLAKTQRSSGLEVLSAYFTIIEDCIRKLPIISTGLSWGDISNSEINNHILSYRFRQIKFNVSRIGNINLFSEDNGLFNITPNKGTFFSLENQSKYVQGKAEKLVSIPRFIDILGSKDKYELNGSFGQSLNTSSRFLLAMDKYKPAPPAMRSEYSYEESFPVKVSFRKDWLVVAETVDGLHVPVSGKVLMEIPLSRGNMNYLKNHIVPDSFLTVYRSNREDYAFELYDSYEDFYRRQACDMAGTETPLVFTNHYPQGTEWIAPNGIRVGIDNSKLEDLSEEEVAIFEEAIANRTPIIARMYIAPPDIDAEKFHVYAEPVDLEPDVEDYTFTDAENNLFKAFMAKSSREDADGCVTVQPGEFKEIPKDNIGSLGTILELASECAGLTPLNRLEFMTAASMLYKFTGRQLDLAYVRHNMEYLGRKVAFASGEKLTSLSHTALLEGNEAVERREKMVSILLKYENPTSAKESNSKDESLTWDEKVSRIDTLVRASNDLAAIIDEREANNIKHTIAKLLDVQEEYESILNDRTYYGDENIRQEFKASAVFPPADKRRNASENYDPELQKWNIIKAVCGFLNSRAGGEVLIGVNDSGYANGIEDDIDALYRHREISVPNTDRYALYIIKILGTAFAEMDGTRDSKEIANTHVDVYPETNDEGRKILRIKIQPYQKKIIKISVPQVSRPDFVADFYYRRNGRTVTGTDGIIQEIKKYK